MRIRFVILIAVILSLVGCTSNPQQPVAMSPTAVSGKSRVAVVMTPLPKQDTYFPGAGCLLCYAAAAMANSSLTDHVRSLPYEDLPQLKETVAQALRSRGVDAFAVTEDLDIESLASYSAEGANVVPKNFSPLSSKYQAEKLVVLQVTTLGFIRTYSAYVATSEPKGVLTGLGYMVNLKNNTYDWYQPISITKSADQNWDEPPRFPGLTNAYFQALELGKDQFLKPFATSASAPVASGVSVQQQDNKRVAQGPAQ